MLELDPGGIAKEIDASDVDGFLAVLTSVTPAEQVRVELAVELLDDIRRLVARLKSSHERIREAVAASGTTLTDVFGVGPIIAAMLIGDTRDIARFAAYNGMPLSSSPPEDASCIECPSEGARQVSCAYILQTSARYASVPSRSEPRPKTAEPLP